MERNRLDTTTAGKAALCAVGDTASRALSSSNRVSSAARSRPTASSVLGNISDVRAWSRPPRLGLSAAPRDDPISTIDAATRYMYTRLAMERAAYIFRLSNMGRERDRSGNTTNRMADDVWSEMRGGCEESDVVGNDWGAD